MQLEGVDDLVGRFVHICACPQRVENYWRGSYPQRTPKSPLFSRLGVVGLSSEFSR